MLGYIFGICLGQVLGNWPMWGGEPTHRSIQLLSGAMTSPAIKWRFAPGGYVEWQFSAIGDANGDGQADVVISSGDGCIYCLKGSDGIPQWFSNASASFSSPVIADVDGDGQAEVLVGSYCLKGSDGSRKWVFPAQCGMCAPTVADCDKDGEMEVVVGSSGDYNIYCIRGLDGTQKWAFPTGGTLRSAPAIDDVDGDDQIEILVCSGDHNLYCLRGTDGVQKWAFPTGGALYSSPVIADVDGDGLKEVLIGASDGNLYCLRGSDGTQKWASPISSNTSSPVVADVDRDGNTDIIIGSPSGVHCLRGSNGTVEWSFPTPTTVHLPGALVDADGDGRFEFLVSQAVGSTLYCLNAESGSVAWQIDLANDIHSPFAGDIDGDGCSEIIVGTQDPDAQGYRVFAIDDPWNSSGCGTLELGETDRGEDFDFRLLGRVLRLFMPQQAQVSLRIYDAQGRLIQRVYEGVLKPGTYTFIPELEAEGVYLAVLRYREGMKTLRIVK